VKKVEGKVDQPAQDAEVTFSGTSLGTVDGQEGVAVKADKLRRAIGAELVLPHADRVVEVSTRVTQPDVTRDELASQYPVVVTVNRSSFELRLWKNLQLVKTYPIAVGQIGLETPAGLYHVQNKAVDPAWTMPNSSWVAPADRGRVIPGGSPENPLKARWLGIYDGAGIHGTDATYSLGTAASHGCIRMAIPDVIDLYDEVPVSTPVYIA
jgi:L,D-transpeptidase-like protein